jgi:hypothetical protein
VIGQILSELMSGGVNLHEVPGLEVLRTLLLPRPAIPPEVFEELQIRYRVQLKQLRRLGFTDIARSVQALIESDGNVGLALIALNH